MRHGLVFGHMLVFVVLFGRGFSGGGRGCGGCVRHGVWVWCSWLMAWVRRRVGFLGLYGAALFIQKGIKYTVFVIFFTAFWRRSCLAADM